MRAAKILKLFVYCPGRLRACACDGETYGNQCAASASKVLIDYIGECTN